MRQGWLVDWLGWVFFVLLNMLCAWNSSFNANECVARAVSMASIVLDCSRLALCLKNVEMVYKAEQKPFHPLNMISEV